MKKNTLIIYSVIFLGVIGITFFMISKPQGSKIHFGRENLTPAPLPDGMLRYTQTVENLNEGWDNIELGDSYKRAGNYEKAIQAYKRAYEVDPRNRIFSGKILIEIYEKNFQYDEALQVVDDILKNQPLVEIGIKRFEEIRARLLAAKAQQQGYRTQSQREALADLS